MANHKHNILLIQMARMGDFIQTTPLISGIKNLFPSCRLWVLVDKNIKELAENDPHIDMVIPVDVEKISRAVAESNNLAHQYCAIKKEFEFLSRLKFECVYNLNLSAVTACISTIPESESVFGYCLSPDGKNIMKNQWFSFLNASVKYLPLAPFNLVDSFYYLLNPAPSCPKEPYFTINEKLLMKAQEKLEEKNVSSRDIVIAFQLATRNIQRQWPIKYFAELACSLLQINNVHIMLLGSPDEKTLSNEVIQHVSTSNNLYPKRVHDFTGNTNLSELASLLKCADLLITCDTGTMHLASAVKCRILALFIGPALCNYTGPYGHDNWIIQVRLPCSPCVEGAVECIDFPCRNAIKPELVLSTTKHILFEDNIRLKIPADVEILKSALDETGIVYLPITGRSDNSDIIQNACYREIGKNIIYPKGNIKSKPVNSLFTSTMLDENPVQKTKTKNILKKCEQLMHAYYCNPYAMTNAMMDQEMSFWHPWIDCCIESAKNNSNLSGNYFISGLQTGRKMLQSLIN